MNRAVVMGVLYGLLICLPGMAFLGLYAGPEIEGRYYPVVRARFVAGSLERHDAELCFSMWFRKLRTATPDRFEFAFVDHGVRVPLSAYKPDGTLLSTPGFANHAAGEEWVSKYCVAPPRVLLDRTPELASDVVYRMM